jgi:hypothetical protein
MPFLYFISGYLIFGLGFAVYFLAYKLVKIDSNAIGTSLGFRLLILPGAILLWPILIFKKKVVH